MRDTSKFLEEVWTVTVLREGGMWRRQTRDRTGGRRGRRRTEATLYFQAFGVRLLSTATKNSL